MRSIREILEVGSVAVSGASRDADLMFTFKVEGTVTIIG